ncbi:MAG: hemolysin III family protein [Clostridiales bacterium]|nr:hemolysin III family protein [Clostridiales bacterium]
MVQAQMTAAIGAAGAAQSADYFRAKDPYSALSHFVGFLLAVIGTFPLLVKASFVGCSVAETLSLCAFMGGAIALYGASTAYHTFRLNQTGYLRLKRLDHAMIYLLIVGSYLPVCVFGLWESGGKLLAATVSGIALLGIVFTMFWVTCPKWLSSAIYIALGWISVLALPQMLQNMPLGAVAWLAAGGILYTVGGVIYAMKLPGLEKRIPGFGAHDLFHLFVLAGTACHYIMVIGYLVV